MEEYYDLESSCIKNIAASRLSESQDLLVHSFSTFHNADTEMARGFKALCANVPSTHSSHTVTAVKRLIKSHRHVQKEPQYKHSPLLHVGGMLGDYLSICFDKVIV